MDEPKGLPKRRHADLLGYRVFRTQRSLSGCLEGLLSRYGLTPAQWNALNQLEHRGPLSQKDLADAVHRRPATITRSIDKMVEQGLVERRPSEADRRVNVVAIMPAARELLSTIEPQAVALANRTQGDLTDEELAQLLSLLDRVYANANAVMDEDSL